jgi:hypothetical protein
MQGPQLDFTALGFSLILFIGITVLFCRSLVKALEYVSPENRAIQPTVIWLLLIPVVTYVVNFIVVFGMSKSIANELESREFEDVKKPAFTLGIASASLALILVVLQMGLFFVPAVKKYIDFIGILSLIQMIVFIQYWMKINWYKQILQRDSEGNESEQL